MEKTPRSPQALGVVCMRHGMHLALCRPIVGAGYNILCSVCGGTLTLANSCFSNQMATLTRPMPFETADGDDNGNIDYIHICMWNFKQEDHRWHSIIFM